MTNHIKEIQDSIKEDMFNKYCLPAIVRRRQGYLFVGPGDEIRLTASAKNKKGRENVCFWSPFFEQTGWAAAEDVLRLTEYLKNQPTDAFWVLAVKASVGGPLSYLADPRKGTNGQTPFRFESEGELLYYVKMNKRDTRQYSAMEYYGNSWWV